MTYKSTKTYGHDLGFSAAFRQWRAHSHCQLIHGYSFGFRFEFEADELDERNWVVDFGGLKPLKAYLESLFDHKVVIASDDPHIEYFRQGHILGVLHLIEVQDVGVEKFAEMVYKYTESWLLNAGFSPRCRLVSVEVKEHGSNSAIYSL